MSQHLPMHTNWPLVRTNSFTECTHETHQRLWWIWHTEIWPCREMEMSNDSLLTAATYGKFSDFPVDQFRIGEQLHFDVTVVNWIIVGRPVLVAFLATLLEATRQHNNGTRIRLPAHAPKIVSGRV